VKIIHIVLLVIVLHFVNPFYAANNGIKLVQLEKLFDRNITNTLACSLDSVIQWCDDVSAHLLNTGNYNKYFEIQLLKANAYCTRGDISLGVEWVEQMLDKAVKINSPIGIKLSGIGIADTYTYSNMVNEAITAYKEALGQFKSQPLPEESKYIKIVLQKLSFCLIQNDQPKEADIYLNELNRLLLETKEQNPIYLFALLNNAAYYVKINQLKLAKEYLDKAEKLVLSEPESLRTDTYNLVMADYLEKTGNYSSALNHYNNISSQTGSILDPGRYTDLVLRKANVYLLLGLRNKASLLFQQVIATKDSLRAQSYVRQVNELRASYEKSQIEFETQKAKNEQTRLIILIISVIFLLIVFTAYYTYKSNRRLHQSGIELKKAKTKAENSVKAKSMILSNMSHEIRTPLNAVTGFSNILIEKSIDDETRVQCNNIIQQNSELLIKLIDDMIDITTLDFGKMVFDIKEQDVIKTCRNVINTVDKIKQTKAQLYFKCSMDEFILETDESRLQQVLFNLIINATKFTTDGYIWLELTFDKESNMMVFTVTDTGCGISPENQKKLFKRFEKLNDRVQGTGLGLSICHMIVNQMGGEIWIDSSYTKGSRFCFTHPIKTHNKR